MKSKPLYLMHLSLHGLIRSTNPEIGRDADTGGQVRYVLDLMGELAKDTRIRRADLITRAIHDPGVSSDYTREIEALSAKSCIRRIAFGPAVYLRKELLWPHLQECTDAILSLIREQGEVPDVVHAHYADAGLVATRLSKVLAVPVVFTGHSLGRFKLANLLARGCKRDKLYETYNFASRIEAEEETIENASLLVASSRNEEQQQYKLYDHYDAGRILVNPPGCDLDLFGRRPGSRAMSSLRRMLQRFLSDPGKPPLILLARPDPQKNVLAAIRIFAQPQLRRRCNLILFLGTREDIRTADPTQRKLMQDVLHLIDKHDLYGSVAYPKTNPPEMAAALFHYAHDKGGALLAPSKHENFGLTLVEAAAAGLPVATSGTGGMKDILEICRHGLVIDPADAEASARIVSQLISRQRRWHRLSENGFSAAHQSLTWNSHIRRYLPRLQALALQRPFLARQRRPLALSGARHLLVCDIDNTLTGNRAAARKLNDFIASRQDIAFGVATGRQLADAKQTLKAWSVSSPQFMITAVGTSIYTSFGDQEENSDWQAHIAYRWKPGRIMETLSSVRQLVLQEPQAQSRYKISYYCDGAGETLIATIKTLLRSELLQANVIVSKGRCIDLVPVRASKGQALRFLAARWRFDLGNIITAGDSGNDIDIISGAVMGIVVGNHADELEVLRADPTIYFASKPSAAGVLEGLHHHGIAA